MSRKSIIIGSIVFASVVGAVLTGITRSPQADERFRLYNVGQTVAWRLNVETGDVSYCALVEHTLVCQDARTVDALQGGRDKAHKVRRQLQESRERIEELEGRLNRSRHQVAELEEELSALRERCPSPSQ